MKRLLLIVLLCVVSLVVSAQKVTHSFQNVSLSDALKFIQEQTTNYDILFIYDELENFRVTTNVQNRSVPEAIEQIVGFYPIRIVRSGREIYVACLHKTKRHLTGNIIDENDLPVAYANIILLNPSDSTLLCGGVSNEAGQFVIPIDQPAVIARISHVGYKTNSHLYHQENAGTVRLQPETQQLKEITVKGRVSVLRHEAGTLIFDTRHIIGAVNATDLLRYTPGVMIENDVMSLFGKSDLIFCIDGKQQQIDGRNLLQMLSSLPASDVERIEIVQNPSVIYSAEGNAGLINIVLKKHSNHYVGGTVGYAMTQYEEHGDEANAGIIFNKDKVYTSLNIAGIGDRTRSLETNAIHFTETLRHHTDNIHVDNNHYSVRWQTDYRASDKLTLGVCAMYSNGERRQSVDGHYDFLPKKLYSLSCTDTQTQRQEDTKTWAVNVNAEQFLGSGGAKITYNLDYYRMRMEDARHSIRNLSIIENNFDEVHQSDTTDFEYQNRIIQHVDNYLAKIDVSFSGFKIGGQYAFTHSHRDLGYNNVGNYEHVSTSYDEQIVAGYAEYSRSFGNQWSVSLGGRYEHTWTKVENQPVSPGFHADYGKLFPSLHVSFVPNYLHAFNWNFSSHITRPNIINISPNEVWKDVNHISYGNQSLKPSYLYKAMMGYTYKSVLNFDLYYTWQLDRIDPVYLVNQQVTNNSWDNITDEHRIGITSSYSFTPLKWMTATLIQGVGYSKTIRPHKEIYLGIVRQYQYRKVENAFYTGMLQATFFFDHDRHCTANLNAVYHSREKDVVKTVYSRYVVDVGFQYRFWKNHLVLGVTCRNLFASHLKGTEYLSSQEMGFDNKLNYRQFRLSLTYNWGASLRQAQRRYESDEIKKRIVNDF